MNGTAPYGDLPVLLRGSFNDWGTSNAFTYRGSGNYQTTVAGADTAYEFKFASEDWYGQLWGGQRYAA